MSKPQKIDNLVLHHIDPDGYCAAGIVRYFDMGVNSETVGMNYGYKIPWNKIKRARKVYMVDFSLPPNDMAKIRDMVGYENFIWIDHHKTVIEDIEESGQKIRGLRRIGDAGCELTWEWFETQELFDKPIPKAVKMIGRYDVWDIEYSDHRIRKEDLFPLVTGIKFHDPDGDSDDFWFKLFESEEYCEQVITEGRVCYEYQKIMFAKYCRSHSFDMEWEGHRFLVVNGLNANSQMFEAKWNQHDYDAMLCYGYTNKNYSVSMYTDKEGIDVGALAHKYGGGGHVQACGFTCIKLPFEDLLEWKKAEQKG
jgi:oligoribonuclease NrnB/cAMP/cGMP phosphodiesterase (DHH superfamily)